MATRQVKVFLETGNIKNSVNFPSVSYDTLEDLRLAVFHKNVPKMVSQFTTALSNYNLNIADMVNRSRGDYAYTMIDIDNEINEDIVPSLEKNIQQIEGIVTVRVI